MNRDEIIEKLTSDKHPRSKALLLLMEENHATRRDLTMITHELTGDAKFGRKGLIARMARVEMAVLIALGLGAIGASAILGWSTIVKLFSGL